MGEFLAAFQDLIVWFLGSATWDGLIIAVPLAFAVISMIVLSFRKAVGLR